MKKWLCLLLLLLPLAAFADTSNLAFYEKTEAEKQSSLAHWSFVIWTEDYSDWSIECFDVREDGMIALGFNRSPEMKYVAVLDADGAFQYGCTFKCAGAFLVDWIGDNLGICQVRGSVLGVFDETGACVSLRNVKTNTAFSRYMNALRQPVRKVGDKTYILRNDHILSFLSTDYGQLVRIDAQGNEIVLHEASGAALAGAAWVCAIVILIGVCMFVQLQKNDKARIDKRLNS